MVKRKGGAATLGRSEQKSQWQSLPAGNGGRAASHHLPPSAADLPYPWLMFSHDKGKKRQTFYTLTKHGLASHRRPIPELRRKTVLACSDGWLVLYDDKNQTDCSLWNLSTLDSIPLPPVKSQQGKFVTGSCVLLSKPTGTTVVLFEENCPLILFLQLGSGQEDWSEIYLGKKELRRRGINEEIDYFNQTASCNGVIYAATFCRSHLFTIEIDEKFVVRSLQMKLPDYERYSACCETKLARCGEDLLTIMIYVGGIGWNEVTTIEVYRLHLADKAWEKMNNFKGHTFFLGPNYNFSCATRSAFETSLVYFIMKRDKKVYCYNIQERSLSIALCFPQLHVPWSGPDWILPSFTLVETQKDKDDDEIRNQEENIINKGKDEEGMNLVYIPSEILGKIAGGLDNLLDYMNFRVICRDFMLAAPAIQWRETSQWWSHSLSPWLVFSGGGDSTKVFNLIDPERGGKYFINIPPELELATIHYSKDGWLLMSRSEKYFFFNPFTKVVLPWLPDLDDTVFGFLFTSLPTSSDCSVIGITGFGVHRCSYGSTEWEYTELIDASKFVCHNHVPVYWNRAIYFMSQKGKLGILTSEEEEEDGYRWQVLDELKVPCSSFHQSFLVQCKDDLMSVFIGDFGTWLQVFRLNLTDLVWEEVNSLGNQALYLSRASAFSVTAKSKEVENRIYIPRVHQGSIVFYSLETRKFHSSQGASFTDYADTVEQLLCGWIEPRWSSQDTGITSAAP